MPQAGAIDGASARRALDRFLADNRELEELTAHLSAFNLFRVLRIEKHEIRHSNVLAWLLNPRENHGLGDSFLRRFLSRMLLRNVESGLVDLPLSAATVELADLLDAEVMREYRNIDILVVSRTNELVLLIENKLGAKESPGQLRKYARRVASEFEGWTVIPLFLTLGGDEPSESDFAILSYEEVLDLVSQVVRQSQDRMPTGVSSFLSHYMSTLQGFTMSNESVVELCKAIYAKHREAIRLITEYGASSQVGQQIVEFLSSEPVNILDAGVRVTLFVPKGWLKYLGRWGPGWSQAVPYCLVCRFVHRPNREKMGLLIEVGPTEPPGERQALVSALDKAGFRVGKLAYREEAKYTRIYSDWKKIKDWEDELEIERLIKAMWEKAQPKVEVVADTLKLTATT